MKEFDTIIIGGGFYGLRIAQYLIEELGQSSVLILEKEAEVMQRASYNNQARVHNGYHYPRSVLTALRSRVNMPVFFAEYQPLVVCNFTKYYGVARNFSKVSARQFVRFYERIGAPITSSEHGEEYFDKMLIEEVFEVQEYAFNSRVLKETLLKKLADLKVLVRKSEEVLSVCRCNDGIEVVTTKRRYNATFVLNTTYSSINAINRNSGLPIIPFKHELTEMCLVKIPAELQGTAFTIMCGPFFSLMPFPDKGLYTLSHVRYTPHTEWYDTEGYVLDSYNYLKANTRVTKFPQMIADIKRYMPLAKKIEYSGESLWEIKTVLPQSEGDDSRPILYKSDHGGIKNYVCIMGGKIDNVYDVFKELKITYGK